MKRLGIIAFLMSFAALGKVSETLVQRELLGPRTGGLFPATIEDFISIWKHEKQFPGGVLLPKGRSLQVDNVSEKDPRMVITSVQNNKGITELVPGMPDRKEESSSFFEGRLFVGFASSHNEREVISMSMETGEFVFMLANPAPKDKIRGFVGELNLRPKIETDILLTMADRKLCLECHVHGGPIFPEGPWTEIDMQHPATKGTDRFEGQVLNYKGLAATGKHLDKGDPTARAVDMAVHVGNRLLQANRMCRSICEGQGAECERTILLSALTNRKQSPFIRTFVGSVRRDKEGIIPRQEADIYLTRVNIPKKMRRRLTNFSEIWPDDGFEYTSHVIPDPIATFSETKLNPRVAVSPRGKIDRISSSQAPAYVYDVSAECLMFRPSDLKTLSTYSLNTIFAFAESQAFERLVQSFPPKPAAVLKAVAQFAKENGAVKAQPKAIEKLSVAQQAEKRFIDGSTGLSLMRRYCTECHVRGINTKIPFTGREDVLLEEWGDLIFDEIQRDSMPQAAAKEHVMEPVVRAIFRKKLLDYLGSKGFKD